MRFQLRFFIFMILLSFLTAVSAFTQPRPLSPEERTQQLKEALALTDEQTAKVKELLIQAESERKEAFEAGAGDRESRMELMRSLGEKTDKQIEALLTHQQNAKFQELKKQRPPRGEGFRRR